MTRESVLINELITLMCKGGCESFVGNFQKDGTVLSPHDQWTEEEVEEAIHYVKYMNEYFGKQEAIAVVTSLIAKFHISLDDISVPKTSNDKVGLES
jgi:hypothetical protein